MPTRQPIEDIERAQAHHNQSPKTTEYQQGAMASPTDSPVVVDKVRRRRNDLWHPESDADDSVFERKEALGRSQSFPQPGDLPAKALE